MGHSTYLMAEFVPFISIVTLCSPWSDYQTPNCQLSPASGFEIAKEPGNIRENILVLPSMDVG